MVNKNLGGYYMQLNGKKILVTGATGFIGSHLIELLVESGCSVKAFAKYNFQNDWGWLDHSHVKNDIEIFLGDIRDYDAVFKAIADVDVIFHLAALIGIPYSYISPLAYIKTNIEGTYNVLQAAREKQVKKIIITSTSETYGTAQYIPIDEKHPLVGQSPYSASKIAADQLAVSYYRSFELPVIIARPFNTYGPRQSARAIIPTIITQLLSGQKKLKLGNLTPTRDLNYVKDIVKGFLKLAESEKVYGQITNLGSNTEISIGELVNLLIKLTGQSSEISIDAARIRPEKSEVNRLVCDNKKIVELTGWQPKYSLEEGLKETLEWFRENLQYYKANFYNV